ncbi:HAD domain-containing protein [Ralstonia pseudosolanacearum]
MNGCRAVPPEPPPSRVDRPWTSTRAVLFLDFDGVLHRGDAYRTRAGIVSSDPSRIQLFEFADVLKELLRPYPHVELVLSTSWVKVLGYNRARGALPVAELRRRTAGATYHTHFDDAYRWNGIPRGEQILRYVGRHRLVRWLAIDDHSEGFGEYTAHLVLCDIDRALGDVAVQERLKAALRIQFGVHNAFAD